MWKYQIINTIFDRLHRFLLIFSFYINSLHFNFSSLSLKSWRSSFARFYRLLNELLYCDVFFLSHLTSDLWTFPDSHKNFSVIQILRRTESSQRVRLIHSQITKKEFFNFSISLYASFSTLPSGLIAKLFTELKEIFFLFFYRFLLFLANFNK